MPGCTTFEAQGCVAACRMDWRANEGSCAAVGGCRYSLLWGPFPLWRASPWKSDSSPPQRAPRGAPAERARRVRDCRDGEHLDRWRMLEFAAKLRRFRLTESCFDRLQHRGLTGGMGLTRWQPSFELGTVRVSFGMHDGRWRQRTSLPEQPAVRCGRGLHGGKPNIIGEAIRGTSSQIHRKRAPLNPR